MSVYNLNIAHHASFSQNHRIGLLYQNTGVPAFLLYLENSSETEVFHLHSASDLENRIGQASGDLDQRAWKLLLPYFQALGKSAYVVTTPYKRSSSTRLSHLIGKDKGLSHRDGIFALRDVAQSADIIAIPQAPWLLKPKSLRQFYNKVLEYLSENEHYFLIIDPPKELSRDQIFDWVKTFNSPSAAIFYPWLHFENDSLPPSPVVSAAFQRNDRELHINELPANQAISGGFQPLFNQTPSQLKECLNHRINTLHLFSEQDLRIWGGMTLTQKNDIDFRFISTRRTAMALKEAIHQLCEPYVLEPIGANLVETIDVSLHSFFQNHRHLFDSTQKNKFHFEVDTYDQDGIEVVRVNVRFSLPYAIDEISFSLGLTG